MFFSLLCWGRLSGYIIPKLLGPDPVACVPLVFIRVVRLTNHDHYLMLVATPFFPHAGGLHIKGGYLSIATHGLLLALQPSPSSLVHGIATWHTSDG